MVIVDATTQGVSGNAVDAGYLMSFLQNIKSTDEKQTPYSMILPSKGPVECKKPLEGLFSKVTVPESLILAKAGEGTASQRSVSIMVNGFFHTPFGVTNVDDIVSSLIYGKSPVFEDNPQVFKGDVVVNSYVGLFNAISPHTQVIPMSFDGFGCDEDSIGLISKAMSEIGEIASGMNLGLAFAAVCDLPSFNGHGKPLEDLASLADSVCQGDLTRVSNMSDGFGGCPLVCAVSSFSKYMGSASKTLHYALQDTHPVGVCAAFY